MNVEFKLLEKSDLNDSIRKIVAGLLEEQGKVNPPFHSKADRCKYICLAFVNNLPVGIGAIKRKTKSVFESQKANLIDLEEIIDFELGYIFTKEEFTGIGISQRIIENLLGQSQGLSLMATTEVEKTPIMVHILLKNEFKHVGNMWPSGINNNKLGLFVRMT